MGHWITGIMTILTGIGHLFNIRRLLRKGIETYVSDKDLPAYQRRLAMPLIALGTIIIVMGDVEKQYMWNTGKYVTMYLVLAAIPLFAMFKINKHYTGSYLPW